MIWRNGYFCFSLSTWGWIFLMIALHQSLLQGSLQLHRLTWSCTLSLFTFSFPAVIAQLITLGEARTIYCSFKSQSASFYSHPGHFLPGYPVYTAHAHTDVKKYWGNWNSFQDTMLKGPVKCCRSTAALLLIQMPAGSLNLKYLSHFCILCMREFGRCLWLVCTVPVKVKGLDHSCGRNREDLWRKRHNCKIQSLDHRVL